MSIYKEAIKIFVMLFVVLINSGTRSNAQQNELVTMHLNDAFSNPEGLLVSAKMPIQKELYSSAQIALSKKINEVQVESIVTYAPQAQPSDWHEIDYEYITPYTWKWVSLKLVNDNNRESTLILRRPVWWLKRNHAENIGDSVWIDIDEFGLEGSAKVTEVYANQLDTRFWDDKREGDYVCQPITGKFEHYSDDVYKLYLKTGDEISVTGNHPLWSHDKSKWVEVHDLRIGENITCRYGKTSVVNSKKLQGTYKVYNIEVYRSHNYFASEVSIRAHNGPPCGIDFSDRYWSKLIEKSYHRPVQLNGVYIAYIAGERVADDYNVVLFSIESLRKSNSPGTFTAAMDVIIEGARRSGATNINFVAALTLNPKMQAYFKSFTQRYSGLTMNVSDNGVYFGFKGKLDEVQRLHTVIEH
jgi:hypothetical protein